MTACLAATLLRASWTWVPAAACVALTILIYILLSDVAIGVSL
ncbi:MAG: hypothetical protein AB7G47_09020 [Mycolicibacterium sp.]